MMMKEQHHYIRLLCGNKHNLEKKAAILDFQMAKQADLTNTQKTIMSSACITICMIFSYPLCYEIVPQIGCRLDMYIKGSDHLEFWCDCAGNQFPRPLMDVFELKVMKQLQDKRAAEVHREEKWTYLPPQSVKAHHGSIVGTEWPHWVRQNLLEWEQDLMVQTTHQIPVSPAEKQGHKLERMHFC